MSEETAEPIFKIFMNNEAIGYETELSVEESIFWLETVKQMILNRIIGSEVPEDE
jgi:hypothetical protein